LADETDEKSNIIPHDFGHEKRQKARRLRKQLDLDALHEANVRQNPLPYLERASERIYQLEKALFEAHLAANEPARRGARTDEAVSLSHAEHDRLLACRDIVARAFQTLIQSKSEE
jgi:hypothetical protein